MVHFQLHNILSPFLLTTTLPFLPFSTAIKADIPDLGADIRYGLWSEVGSGIGEENNGDLTGYAVATSAEGDIIAVGSPLHNSDFGKKAGKVAVYQYNQYANIWEKIGPDLVGDVGDEMGRSLALSITGDFLAVGAPKCSVVIFSADGDESVRKEAGCVRVYERTTQFGQSGSEQYELLGNIMEGVNSFDHFGTSVSINDIYTNNSGDITIEDLNLVQVAIGAPGAKNAADEVVGRAYMKEFVIDSGSNEWTDASKNSDGSSYVGEGTPGSGFGISVSLSIDNDLMVVGAPKANFEYGGDEPLFHAGAAFLFERITLPNDGKEWSAVTDVSFHGDGEGDECGTSVSMTLRGNFLAFGCPKASFYDEEDNLIREGGLVEVWEIKKQGGKWDYELSSADELLGENSGDFFGQSISIGEDADINGDNIYLAVGSPNRYPTPSKQRAGNINVFHLKDLEWHRANLDINGYYAFDEFGTSVAVNYDGHRVIGGAPGQSGYAKIFDLKYTEAPTPSPTNIEITSPTERKPSKPTDKIEDLSYDKNHSGGGVSPFVVTLLLLIFIPALLFLVFKGVTYWKGRRHYKSDFGADVQIATPTDLEMIAQTGPGSSLSNRFATSAEISRDII